MILEGMGITSIPFNLQYILPYMAFYGYNSFNEREEYNYGIWR